MGIEGVAGVIGERFAEAAVFLIGFFIVKRMLDKKKGKSKAQDNSTKEFQDQTKRHK